MRKIISYLLVKLFLIPSGHAQQKSSSEKLVDDLWNARELSLMDMPAKSIFLQETCQSQISVGPTIDEKLKFFCHVVNNSDHCKNVPKKDLRDCKNPSSNIVTIGVDVVMGCFEGIFKSIKDLLSFIGEAAIFIFENLTSLNKLAETADRISKFSNSIKLYAYTEYHKELKHASYPQKFNAGMKTARKLLTHLFSKLGDMLKEHYQEFGCFNDRAQNDKVCKTISDFVIPPAGFFAFLKYGPKAAKSFPSLSHGLSKLKATSKLAAYSSRLSRAKNILGKTLSQAQEEAIVAAHLVGVGEIGKNGALAQVGNYTQAHIRKKAEILKKAGFSSEEIRKLMEQKIVGLDQNELRSFFGLFTLSKTPQNPSLKAASESLKKGAMPSDPYISYVNSSGERLPGKIKSIDPYSGDVSILRPDGITDVIRKNQLRTIENSDFSKKVFSQIKNEINPSLKIPPHADSSYESIRASFRTGKIPSDPYISFETPSGERLAGKITEVNSVTGEVKLILYDGTTTTLSGEALASVRQSLTSKNAFTGAVPSIKLTSHPEPRYQMVREALNRGQIPSNPFVSYLTHDGDRLAAKIEKVDPIKGEVSLITEDGSRIVIQGEQLETMRHSSLAEDALRNTPPAPLMTPPPHPAISKYQLHPKHQIGLRGVDYKVSDFFTDGDGRVFVIAEVMSNGESFKRVFYRSNSSASFRNLPARNRGIPAPGYDKGPGEEFLAAPPELQAFLAKKLETAPPTYQMSRLDPEELEGIIPVNRTYDEYQRYVAKNDYLGNQVADSENIMASAMRDLSSPDNFKMPAPKNVVIANHLDRPNFSRPKLTYQLQTELGGEVEAMVYSSLNGKFEYTLLKDKSGKIWFSDIGDALAPINSHGVRSKGVTGKELLTPRWEYHQQIPRGYAGATHTNHKSYSDAWNYIKEIPEIRRWYQENGLPIPE